VGNRSLPTKVCASCGREMAWRKAWARNWDDVRYCSQRCRRNNISERDRQLESTIVRMLHERPHGSRMCLSEVARACSGDQWHAVMEPTRQAARRLVDRGIIVIMQQGHIVEPSTAKGPMQVVLVRQP